MFNIAFDLLHIYGYFYWLTIYITSHNSYIHFMNFVDYLVNLPFTINLSNLAQASHWACSEITNQKPERRQPLEKWLYNHNILLHQIADLFIRRFCCLTNHSDSVFLGNHKMYKFRHGSQSKQQACYINDQSLS